MKKQKLDLRYKDDFTIYLFNDLFEIEEFTLCGIEETQPSSSVRIEFDGKVTIIPSFSLLYQTEDEFFDAFPANGLHEDLPLLSADGFFGINRIENYTITKIDEIYQWTLPLIPPGHSIIMNTGLVVVPNPVKPRRRRKA